MSLHSAEPFLLSIESSADVCGVALSQGPRLLGEYICTIGHSHDRLLARYCQTLLADCGLTVDKLAAVAISAGPGSFTGLRIGAGLAKALCFTDSPRLIAVPTLQAFAAAAEEFAGAMNAGTITAAVLSHKELVYSQVFSTRDLQPITDLRLQPLQEFTATIQPETVCCGTVAAGLQQPCLRLSGLNRHTPRFIARLALRMYRQEQFTPAAEFIPFYGQEFRPLVSPASRV
jgi:tRNA threonylcarbamoyladenosine biosynthesis protein TsaB